MESAISIKGTREGLAIALGLSDLDDMLEELGRHLRQQGAFFRGGIVTLEAGQHSLTVQDLKRFQELLEQHAMVLRSISTTDESTLRATRELGLHLAGAEQQTLARERPAPVAEAPQAVETSSPAPVSSALEPAQPATAQPSPVGDAEGIDRAGARGLVLRRRVRAGQTVRHSGSVVVIGDVNAGAEIVAGGDVVVWGRLRGTVHAGCLGNTSAVVCALDLSPLQLRIAELITRPEEGGPGRDDNYPEVAYVRDQTIFVERWTSMRWRD
jgi:septum site-determining protein MinC